MLITNLMYDPLLARLEKTMIRLVNLRSSEMPSYKELRIPTDWMLDSGAASKGVHLARSRCGLFLLWSTISERLSE